MSPGKAAIMVQNCSWSD